MGQQEKGGERTKPPLTRTRPGRMGITSKKKNTWRTRVRTGKGYGERDDQKANFHETAKASPTTLWGQQPDDCTSTANTERAGAQENERAYPRDSKGSDRCCTSQWWGRR